MAAFRGNQATFEPLSEELGLAGIARARQTLKETVTVPSIGLAAEEAFGWWDDNEMERQDTGVEFLGSTSMFLEIFPLIAGFAPGVGGFSRYKFTQLRSLLENRQFGSVDSLMLGGDDFEEIPDELVDQWNNVVSHIRDLINVLTSHLDALRVTLRARASRSRGRLNSSDLVYVECIHILRDFLLYSDAYREQRKRDDAAARIWAKLTECLKEIQPELAENTSDESATQLETSTDSFESVEEVLAELDALVGHEEVKASIHRLVDTWRINHEREHHGLPEIAAVGHFVFIGNPGTGKTTVARILGRLMTTMGFLSTGNFVECGRADLVGEYIGHTAIKTRTVLDDAKGGVLFIDEAYALDGGGENDFGKEAIGEILKYMEDNRDDLIVIAAGYRDEMRRFLDMNPGLPSRFSTTLDFKDLETDLLVDVFKQLADDKELVLDEGVLGAVTENIEVARKRPKFDNARFVRTLFESTVRLQSERLAHTETRSKDQLVRIVPNDVPLARPHRSNEDLVTVMAELDELVGLDDVKERIRSLISKVQVDELRKKAGLIVNDFSPHMVFSGAPGTGKTTVARIVGRAMAKLGLLRSGHVIETDRSGLVAGYIGQTAIKTADVCESARDGILFIDEAYSLVDSENESFGQESIDTILKFMEDNRGQITVIAAGYPEQMKEFLLSNPGLPRRFDFEVQFQNYSLDELIQIARNDVKRRGYVIAIEAERQLRAALEPHLSNENFGNAGEVRKQIDVAILRQTSRLVKSGESDPAALQFLAAIDFRD